MMSERILKRLMIMAASEGVGQNSEQLTIRKSTSWGFRPEKGADFIRASKAVS